MIQPIFGRRKPFHRRMALPPLYCTLIVAGWTFWDATSLRADIDNWLTHQAIPGTQGITPGPSVVLDNLSLDHAALGTLNLTSASFSGAVITNAQFQSSNLTAAVLTNANLAGAFLSNATLTGANLSGATISGTSFASVLGLTLAQLYSTASYTTQNMQNIVLSNVDLHGGNFTGQNLFHTNMQGGNLASSTFGGVNLGSSNLSHTDLTNASLANASLSFANLASSTFTGADFTGVDITGAVLNSAVGLAAAQIYSTSNYQAQSLQGIVLSSDDLSNWNLSHQNLELAFLQFANLAHADFNHANLPQATLSSATLTSANLDDADLSNANFFSANASDASFTGATLANTNFTCADVRGATGFVPAGTTITDNTILPDGTVPILHLTTGQTLTVRNSTVPVSVTNAAQIDSGAVMQINGSQVTFNQPLTVNGTLNVANAGQATNFASSASGNGSINVAAGSSLTFPQSTEVTVTLDITGQGGISQTGTGTTTLSGNYAASGPVTASAGKLIFGVTPLPRQTPGVLLNMQSLTLTNQAILDVTNHDLMIGNSDLTTVQNEVLSGFGIGPGGAQITSSTALADGNKIIIPFDATANAITSWDGVPVTQPNTIIAKYTFSADANFDGKVNFNDYTVITGNYGQTTPGMADIGASFLAGDLNLDGKVDFNDYTVVTGLYGAGTGAPLGTLSPLSVTSVPEPASLFTLAAAALMLRRRKSHP